MKLKSDSFAKLILTLSKYSCPTLLKLARFDRLPFTNTPTPLDRDYAWILKLNSSFWKEGELVTSIFNSILGDFIS